MKTLNFTQEKITKIKTFNDVYCDQLKELFSEVTGLELRMPKVIGINAQEVKDMKYVMPEVMRWNFYLDVILNVLSLSIGEILDWQELQSC